VHEGNGVGVWERLETKR